MIGNIQSNRLYISEESFIAYNQHKKKSNTKSGIVYLTGYGSDMQGNKALAIEEYCINNNHDYLRFDYLGCGQSSGAFEDYSIIDWIDNSIEAIDKLTNGPQIIIGSSMGGWIMIHLALKRQSRIAGLIGIAPAPDFTELLMWNQLPDSERQELLTNEKILINHTSGEEYFITKKMVEDGRKMLVMHQIIDIHHPVSIIHGMRDDDVPYQMSIELVNNLASNDVELHLVKNAMHRFSEEPDIEFILDCLKRMVNKISSK